jgi:hypothetical protein
MLPDWQYIENRLYEESKAGILRFAAEHPETTCSFFAYSANPFYGEFHLCFDTPQNALEEAQYEEQQAIKWRNNLLERGEVWRHATNPDFVELVFKELREIGFDPNYPESGDYEDDYANGNGQLIMWRVLERLIEDGVFFSLRLTSPFRVGYKIHDGAELVVLRILNWPQIQQLL